MHETQPGQPEHDFDTFLSETIQQSETLKDNEIRVLFAQQQVVTSLENHGALLLVATTLENIQANKAALSNVFLSNNSQRLEDEYYQDESTQQEISLDQYIDDHVYTELEIMASNHNLILSLATMHTIASENYPDEQHVTDSKKNLLAALIIQDLVVRGDTWFEALNTSLPGEALDLDSLDDQPYLIDALEKYTNAQAKQNFLKDITLVLIDTVIEHFPVTDLDHKQIDNLLKDLAPWLVKHELMPVKAEAEIDEIIRNTGASTELSEIVKELARACTDFSS